MIVKSTRSMVCACLVALVVSAVPAVAQITTGNVHGSVKDSTGGVVPGATVVLISEARGTKSVPAVTNATGDYVFPNITPDTYTVEVTMDGFRTVRRAQITVTGGDRVTVPALTLEPGGAEETVTVTSEAPLIQASSGERSFAISTVQIENLPINHGNFTAVTAFTPGVVSGGASAGGTRLGGVGQNNIMMDGISAMDTGNNGQMINMNIESIAEVKVLTQGYQAEYGRSSGLQITAVTKSGTNRFRGSAYDIKTNSDWNENSWQRSKNGDPKPIDKRDVYGYSIGGPVGKPGGNNKLFFFYTHEYRPTNAPINNGNAIRYRVPTDLERRGDFSQTRDNNGNLFNFIADTSTGLPCGAADTRGCFQDGGVLGRIPQSRLNAASLALLSRYPIPTQAQAQGSGYNYEQLTPPSVEELTQQPAVRVDYQLSSKLRVSGKYSGQRGSVLTRPGLIQGFTDALTPYPFITNYGVTVNYALNPTTFIEGTYGFIRNELAGGNENGILVNDSSNRLGSMPGFPLIYPNAGVLPKESYGFEVMEATKPPFWDGTSVNLPPVFNWGSRIGANNTAPAPPNQRYPGWLNINRTQDVAISATKVAGRHTFKGGFYNNHSFKAQNAGVTFQGTVDFNNDTNNLLDSGFGFANAALGVFSRYQQAEKFVEGSMKYNNTEFYIQDNWKVNSKLTLDYGVRFTHQQPQYDQFLQLSNFFPELWSQANAPVLYVAGCSNGATVCSGVNRNAMDPRNGQIVLPPTGAANTQVLIGTPIPGAGNPLNGIRQAGDGISDYSYTWPAIVFAPRFGAAYDLSGDQRLIVRGGIGLFYDRPDGNTVFSIPNNPPITNTADLRNGTLATLGGGLAPGAVPGMITFQYDADVPASWQWQGGVQMSLPWSSSLDVSYVGNRGWNRLGGLQNGNLVNQNAIDFGAAYQPKNQDPTQAASTVPGATAYVDNLLRTFRGLGNINQNTTDFWDEWHSIQTSYQRRFQNGFMFGANYTLALSLKGNTGTQKRLQHAPDGTISIRSDQAEYEAIMEDLHPQRHVLKVNGVWDLPDLATSGAGAGKKTLGYILNDWQISGVLTANSGTRYDITYTYQSNGAAKNLTGSPDYNARIVYLGDPGSGCSANQYAQFNASAVTGPSYNSLGMESGRNLLANCADKTVDLSLSRSIRLGGSRQLQFRADVFNAFNVAIINDRQAQIQYDNPISKNILNAQYNADGSVVATRLTPRNAGFGAATAAQNMRNIALQIRFQF